MRVHAVLPFSQKTTTPSLLRVIFELWLFLPVLKDGYGDKGKKVFSYLFTDKNLVSLLINNGYCFNK